MDLNVKKFGLTCCETVFEQMIEQSVDTDVVMPDYYSDIERVLKCVVTPRIASKSINGSQLTVEGNISICVIYTDPENALNSFENIINFSKTIDIGLSTTQPNIMVKASTGYINCKAATNRKLDVHGAINLVVKITENKVAEVISDISSDCVEQLCETIDATVPVSSADKSLIIDEEVSLQDSQPEIEKIIRCDSRAIVSESRVIGNKCIVKGNIIIKVLYCTENSRKTNTFTGELPYSQVVELNGADENCEIVACAEICHINVRCREDESGEMRKLAVDSKLNISVTAYCNNKVPVVVDAFSPKYEAEIASEEIGFEQIGGGIRERFMCRKTLDFGAAIIGSIADMWCTTTVKSIKHKGGKLLLEGTAVISVIGFDNDAVPIHFERSLDFEYISDDVLNSQNLRYDANILTLNCGYNILSENAVDANIELEINVKAFAVNKINLLTAINVNENAKKTADDSAIVMYYPDEGETVWDISKKYNTSPELVKEINELTPDNRLDGKMLLIPCV